MTKNVNNGSDKATLSDVYNLVDRKITEVNATVIRLENKFDNLEAGRLTRLEGVVADAVARIAGYEGKQTGAQYMVPILISVAMGIFTFILTKVLK